MKDNENLREVLTDYLTDQGYLVEARAGGLTVWDLFAENRYDLVLLDVMVPGMDGFALCKEIRKQRIKAITVKFSCSGMIERIVIERINFIIDKRDCRI